MSKFKIRAVAPTSYQLKSLSHFGLPSKKYLSGEHIGELFFDTEKEAKDHLVKRAELYYEDEAMLTEALAEIEKYGSLQLDAVKGRIEEEEEEN